MTDARRARRPRSRDRGWQILVDRGACWLGSPDGSAWYGCGVNGVNAGYRPRAIGGRPAYDLWRLYPSVDAWAATTRNRLRAWGFNHIGAWAFREDKLGLPSIPNLDLGRRSQALWDDPFEPALPARVTDWARRLTRPHRRHGLRIGYFLDNEVGWWNGALWMFYLARPWTNVTKRLLWRLLYEHYDGSWRKLLNDWSPSAATTTFASLRQAGAVMKLRPGGRGIAIVNEFMYRCAERYYRVTHDAVRAADPQALIFSDRLPIYYAQDAVRAMAPYVDAIAVNYNLDGPDGWVARYFFDGITALADKAILVTEFFCAAMENRSGNRNTGHLLTVATQADRARAIPEALRNFAGFAQVVGTHWFQYSDEPRGGRLDGEDYNVGLVDIADRPYDEVVGAFQCTNPALTGVHADAGRAPRPDGDAQMVTIVRAAHAVDLTDASLTDWDKASTLLRGFAAEPPYVPFADVYLAWAPAGLYLATIGMDYMHPDHLAYEGRFPLSESYQLHLLVFLQGRTHHCAVHWVPEEVTFASSDSTNARGSITLVPSLRAYTPEGARGALPGAVVQHLRAAAPRISCEAYFPAAIFGRPRFDGGLSLRMNIVLRSHYGAQEMFWAAGTQAGTFTRPEGWRPVRLGSTGAGATWRIGRRSERERLCSV